MITAPVTLPADIRSMILSMRANLKDQISRTISSRESVLRRAQADQEAYLAKERRRARRLAQMLEQNLDFALHGLQAIMAFATTHEVQALIEMKSKLEELRPFYRNDMRGEFLFYTARYLSEDENGYGDHGVEIILRKDHLCLEETAYALDRPRTKEITYSASPAEIRIQLAGRFDDIPHLVTAESVNNKYDPLAFQQEPPAKDFTGIHLLSRVFIECAEADVFEQYCRAALNIPSNQT